ncbi:urease accessory protein UreD [Halovulum dunhuangense]|nr:urease accessory protein UreD [Halovulum dunhuangense]
MSDPVQQRARGAVRVGFFLDRGATRLCDLYQQGSAKAMLPRVYGTEPVAVLINTAGGLTGGDRFRYEATLGAGARATLATQTAERAYRAASDTARVDVALRVGPGARLDWLPQETILFEGSALSRRLDLDLEGDATALVLESVVLGRAAMGEMPAALNFRDDWRIRRDGRLIHAEALRLAPPLPSLRDSPAALGDARAMATAVYLGADAADRLESVRAWPATPGVRMGASAWDGRLVLRWLAPTAQPLRVALIDFLTRFRDTPPPRVWTM